MLLADVVATSTEVAATRSRKAKTAAFAELFARVADSSAEEIETVTSYLAGSLRQRRTGLGWRSMQSLPAPAAEPSLTVLEVHEAFERIAALSGSGSQARPRRRDRRAVRAGDRRGAALAARHRHRRGPAGCARLARPGGAGGRGRRAPRRRTPRRDDGRLDGRRVRRRADRWRGGAGGVRARGRAAGAADARLQRDHGRGGDGRRPAAADRRRSTPSSTGSGSRCTGRDDAGDRRDPLAGGHHRPAARGGRRSRGRCRRRGSSSTARCWRSTTRAARGRSRRPPHGPR